MKIVTVLGTRPEIIKLSPLLPLLDKEFEHVLVHTGQHYDYSLDTIFFKELELREPTYRLDVGSHSHGKQTGKLLEKIEEMLLREKPQLVIVQGDTNSTLAGALAAAKLFIPIMHVESGCRSYSKELPEEINKCLVPHIAQYCIAADDICYNHLLQEGIPKDRIHLVGSTIFDAIARAASLTKSEAVLQKWGLRQKDFILLTVHRAENTHNPPRLREMVEAFNEIAEEKRIVFPIHPGTKRIMQDQAIKLSEKITVIEPTSYLDFLALLSSCLFCMSDSGGIQEEAPAVGVPCLILRNETEWTRLTVLGKNLLVGVEKEKIVSSARKLLTNHLELQRIRDIPFSYQKSISQRIVNIIKRQAALPAT